MSIIPTLLLILLLYIGQGANGHVVQAVDGLVTQAAIYTAQQQLHHNMPDTALKLLNRLISQQPQSVAAYVQRGQVYLNLYEWDRALADFNQAIALAPQDASSYYHRGILYYSVLQTGQELRATALADFEQYLALAPDGPYAAAATAYAQTIRQEQAALNE